MTRHTTRVSRRGLRGETPEAISGDRCEPLPATDTPMVAVAFLHRFKKQEQVAPRLRRPYVDGVSLAKRGRNMTRGHPDWAASTARAGGREKEVGGRRR